MKQSSIIFIIIIVIILLIVGAVWVWQKDTKPDGITPTPPTPVEPTEPVEPTPPQEPDSVQIPEGWKTYRNTEMGFELAYPGEWFVYDLKRFNEDNKNRSCYPHGPFDIDNIVILNRTSLGICVVGGISAHVGDLEVSVFPNVSPDEYKKLTEDPNEDIEYKRKVRHHQQAGGLMSRTAPRAVTPDQGLVS